jgi:alpha-beta hydrolase superfamily lysophospholipase
MKQHVTNTVRNHVIRGYEDRRSDTVVVFFHGFTGHMAESGRLFYDLAERFAAGGYSTLRFDWLGHGESDLAFDEIRVPLLQEQAKVVLDYAKQNYKTIHLLGFSMGGAFAMNALDDTIETAILLAPAFNMSNIAEYYFKDTTSDLRDLGGILLHRAFAEGFRALDTLKNAKRFKRPILLVQGEMDQAVPLGQTEYLHEQLPTSRLVVVPEADHCFHRQSQHHNIAETILAFLSE